ncbi:2TM domain-containing protein [Capnocytophaga sp.]|uniref:2TM domain-containing protein n=1 Tax=Capnocytophaga sp. TaxID=44737 RepID=UPI0026DB66A1|nr:2TM domain-containing protein [Capnocytophaga sp.]MDO5105080.1 2TM domain-containing protein [Capnocytophaga sp.]
MQDKIKMEPAQHELFEDAQRRIKQKKMLFFHFWVFILGCIFMVVINKLLYSDVTYNWYLWGILAWSFLFLLHVVNVFIVNRFMGKDWERKHRQRLVELQQKKLLKMEVSIEQELQKEKAKAEKELLNTQNKSLTQQPD